MGAFGDMIDSGVDFFTSEGGAALAGAGIGLIGNIWAADTASDAAAAAAAQGIAGTERQIQFLQEGRNRGTEAVRGGGEAARAELAPIASVTARGFTPEQEISLEDQARRSAATLAAGGLRGSGRAITAGVLDNRRRAEAGFLDENRRRSDAARLERAGSLEREGSNVANIETGSATNLGGAAARGGEFAAGGTSTAGNIDASAILANAELLGRTLGTIGAVTASEEKRANNQREDEPTAGTV